MEHKTKLNGIFEIDTSFENDVWLKTSIRTFAFGHNRNNSNITKDTFDEFKLARKTIGGIPVVAKYNVEKDNLEGHNVILRTNKNDEYELFHDTDALGFTSPTSGFYFEEVNEGTELSPDIKTYVVIEDVYLWKRFDATKKILEWAKDGIPTKVSMEIDNVIGSFSDDGYFRINDFGFSGICALGSDIDPCFSKAEIQLYTANEFKKDLKELMYELTGKELVDKGGQTEMEQVNHEQVEETVETTDEAVVEVGVTETVEETFEQTEEIVDDTVETTETEITEEVVDEVNEEFTTETTEESTETIEPTEDFEAKFNDLTEQYNALLVEVADLKQFKRQTLETELASKFTGKLSDDELKDVFMNSKEKDLADIEKELFALIGKKNFTTVNPTPVTNKVAFSKVIEEEPISPYGDFFKK